MGVSFKVAKLGTRYGPKTNQTEEKDEIFSTNKEEPQERNDATEGNIIGSRDHSYVNLNRLLQSGSYVSSQDQEVSFSLNLFCDGFSVGKPSEVLKFVPKVLQPYDRASKMFFSAIEYGLLPGDILDDIPCKFANGAISCEVRDYRQCILKLGSILCSVETSLVVHKVHLHMCMETVVKDISSISDSCTEDDQLEIESRILKSLQPELCLDPTPLLDRLSVSPISKKLNLGIFADREKKRHSNKVAANFVPNKVSKENNSSNSWVTANSNSNLAFRDGGFSCAHQAASTCLPNQPESNTVQGSFGHEFPMISKSNWQAAVSSSKSISKAAIIPSNFIYIPKDETTDSYGVVATSSVSSVGKRERVESHITPRTKIKKLKHKQLKSVQVAPHHVGRQMSTTLESHMQCESTPQQQRANSISARFSSKKHSHLSANDIPESTPGSIPRLQIGVPSYPDQSGVSNLKQDPIEDLDIYNQEMEKLMKSNPIIEIGKEQPNLSLSKMQQFTACARAHVPFSAQVGQLVEKDLGEPTKKRISTQIAGVSSPAPSYSELPSSSNGISSSTSLKSVSGSQKEKITSVLGVADRSKSLNRSHNSTENQASLPGKRKYNSRLKTVRGVEPPAGASNVARITSSSLPITSECDPILERFKKIKTLAQKYGLNSKKCTLKTLVARKSSSYVPQLPAFELLNSEDTEAEKDANVGKFEMSKCLFWRNRGSCLTRMVTCMRMTRVYNGNGSPVVLHESQKLVVSEKPKDRKTEVYIFYGDEKEEDLGALPKYSVQHFHNTHSVDLYVAQFISLMKREGYNFIKDELQPVDFHTIGAFPSQQQSGSTNIQLGSGVPQSSPSTLISGQSSTTLSNLSRSISIQNPQLLSSKHILAEGHLLPRSNVDNGSQFSTDNLSKSYQVHRSVDVKSMNQQQQPHMKKSPLLIGTTNSLANTRIQMGNQMVNDSVFLQLLSQEQPMQQSHQLSLVQNSMFGGVEMAFGKTNEGMMQSGGGPVMRNLHGLGLTSKVMGVGCAMSTPMGRQTPGLCNVGQSCNLNSWGRGQLSGVSMPGNLVDGMMANNLMHGWSSLGQASTSGGIGPYPSAGTYMDNNVQTPQQLAIIPQKDLDQMQRMLSLLQPPLGYSLHQQIGSPQTHVTSQYFHQQAQMNPQQIDEHALMSMQHRNLGANVPQQEVNAGAMMTSPMSPQLSSQTLGSMNSVTGSPMEFQSSTRGE